MTTFVTRDLGTGLRRGPIRWPDGSPPPPFGCRWCGIPHRQHGGRRSLAVGLHVWMPPANAQILARMKARAKARRTARDQAAAEKLRLRQCYAEIALAARPRPERCEEMAHNSIGSETFCIRDDPDHDGLCEDGTGFEWLGVRNEERGQ